MNYIKKFETHNDFKAFEGSAEMVRPNVSHCVQENEVHYRQNVSVLSGNEAAWEEYQQWICEDTDRLERDLVNIFSKYAVDVYNYNDDNNNHYRAFTYSKEDIGNLRYISELRIKTSSAAEVQEITNSCGKTYIKIPNEWEERTIQPKSEPLQ